MHLGDLIFVFKDGFHQGVNLVFGDIIASNDYCTNGNGFRIDSLGITCSSAAVGSYFRSGARSACTENEYQAECKCQSQNFFHVLPPCTLK